jgi:hypothetical protein
MCCGVVWCAQVFRPTPRSDFQFFNVERLQELEKKDFESKHKMKILKEAEKVRLLLFPLCLRCFVLIVVC